MSDSIWDADEDHFRAQWGDAIATPEVLAWWRAEKARRAARTPEEIVADEQAEAEDANFQARQKVLDEEHEAAQEELYRPTRALLKHLNPKAVWPYSGEPAINLAEWYVLSTEEVDELLAAVREMRVAVGSRVESINRRRAMRVAIITLVGILVYVAVLRGIPRAVPIGPCMIAAGVAAYFAGLGSAQVMRTAAFGYPHASELTDSVAGEDIFRLERRLATVQERMERGLAARQKRDRWRASRP